MFLNTCTKDTFQKHALSTADISTRYGSNKSKTLPAIGIVPAAPVSKERNVSEHIHVEDHWLPGKHETTILDI